jgi:hypothetical protein
VSQWYNVIKYGIVFSIFFLYLFARHPSVVWMKEILSAGGIGEGEGPGGRWLKKTQLFDSKKSVNAVQFAPRYIMLFEVNIKSCLDTGYFNWPDSASFLAELHSL